MLEAISLRSAANCSAVAAPLSRGRGARAETATERRDYSQNRTYEMRPVKLLK